MLALSRQPCFPQNENAGRTSKWRYCCAKLKCNACNACHGPWNGVCGRRLAMPTGDSSPMRARLPSPWLS
eukprot:12721885-Prorocentrum_lima.AAC.1